MDDLVVIRVELTIDRTQEGTDVGVMLEPLVDGKDLVEVGNVRGGVRVGDWLEGIKTGNRATLGATLFTDSSRYPQGSFLFSTVICGSENLISVLII